MKKSPSPPRVDLSLEGAREAGSLALFSIDNINLVGIAFTRNGPPFEMVVSLFITETHLTIFVSNFFSFDQILV